MIIDEVGEMIRHLHQEIPLATRYSKLVDPDGDNGRLVFHKECPKHTRSGNCDNCFLEPIGLECIYKSGLAIRELRHPEEVRIQRDGKCLREFVNPLTPRLEEFELGPEVRVGSTTFAREVLGHRRRPISNSYRKNVILPLFRRNEMTHKHPREDPYQVLTYMMDAAFRPVITIERPVEATTGLAVDTSNAGDTGVVLPRATCGIHRLRWTDLAVLEKMRRFAESEGVGIVFAGAVLSPDERDTIKQVWPDLVKREHPGQDRKIRQVALVFVNGYESGCERGSGRQALNPILDASGDAGDSPRVFRSARGCCVSPCRPGKSRGVPVEHRATPATVNRFRRKRSPV